MKELSIKEKAKAYDSMFERLKEMYNNNKTNVAARLTYERYFPELKESEDERIRKYLIKCVNENMFVKPFNADGFDKQTILAWLENQGEQKPVNKVEPKFHEGDFILNGDLTDDGKTEIFRVLKVCDTWYDVENIYDSRHTIITFKQEYSCRVWNTIQDAKDGDVLCCESGWTCIFKALDNHTNTFSSYCFMDNTRWFCETGSECHTLKEEFVKAYNGKILPATKEQSDLLFQKMHEAGYEWDAENKQLRKIEEKPDKIFDSSKLKPDPNPYWTKAPEYQLANGQNPAWSEEDENLFRCAIDAVKQESKVRTDGCLDEEVGGMVIEWLKSLKDRVQPKQEWSKEDEVKINRIVACLENLNAADNDILLKDINWLKSLRPQNKWKPSDLPHWKKSTLPNDNTTGFNSDYFCYKGYNINYKELFEKLPKDDLKN